MDNRQTLVVGALGVLVGMVVGASSTYNAQIVSYSAQNPNSPLVRNAVAPSAPGWLREFSDGGIRYIPFKTSSLTENADQRAAERLHSAAASLDGTILGVSVTIQLPERCIIDGIPLSRTRLAECLANEDWVLNNYFLR